ncbi:PEP/pyruvate-binding domain-containing protein [Pelagibacterium halotolerans]|uniref:PEP/pyruvate-binding domain-containing protein n=1 Tax=Pelagibacterium halotolerans TaxID=531813 RepID=UPI00384BB434
MTTAYPALGGKAANLMRLSAMGWAVPDFHVIPSADFKQTGEIASEAIERHRKAMAGLGGDIFAVRSSAIDEDGTDNSFAGQFLSLLHVSRNDLEAAAAKVYLSGAKASVAAYRAQRGSGENAAPSVIVQRMIVPLVAGVVFSTDPVTSRPDHMVISAISGVGEALMAGTVNGWTYLVDSQSVEVLDTTPGEGDAPLSPADITAIADAARRIAAQMGAAQDIEWAIDADGLHILQSRPITTIQTGAWRIWDNSNIVESYPGWVSPLTFSFARSVYAHVYRRLLANLGAPKAAIAERHAAFEGLLGRFEGRVYYELGNWHRLLSALPAYRLNARFMDQMMGVDEPLPKAFTAPLEAQAGTGSRLAAGVRMARAGFGLATRSMLLGKTIKRFRARLERALNQDALDFTVADLDALAAHWRGLERDLLSRWDAPLLNDLCCMIAVGLARKCLTDWGGERGAAIFNDTLIGQGEIVSAEPPQRIRAMAESVSGNPKLLDALRARDLDALRSDPAFADQFDAYIEKFGDRCAAELKLESATLEDDPAPVLDAVLAAATRPAPRAETGAARITGPLLPGRPVRSVIAGWLLGLAARRVRDRENLRFDRTRVFGRVRRIVRAMGARLADAGTLERADDVFYLTIDELQGGVEGWGVSANLSGLAKSRRKQAETEHGASLPDRFETRGAVATATPIVPRKRIAETGDHRAGLGCSAGRVTGVARIVLDPVRASVNAGEILVARNTDPGWIALFANAGAVVVEKGSILSHSAIVAREMGIPCVVGIKAVTDWIPDGATIAVDGGAGTVRIIR